MDESMLSSDAEFVELWVLSIDAETMKMNESMLGANAEFVELCSNIFRLFQNGKVDRFVWSWNDLTMCRNWLISQIRVNDQRRIDYRVGKIEFFFWMTCWEYWNQ